MKTKREFLRKLRKLLLWKYDSREIVDIMRDYEEYFDIALEKGKSETDIIRELGEPLEIVRTIKEEMNRKERVLVFNRKSFGRNVLAVFLIMLTLAMLVNIKSDLGIDRFWILAGIYLPVISLGVWFLLGGRYFSMGFLEEERQTGKEKAFYAVHGLFILCMLLSAGIFIALTYNFLGIWNLWADPAAMGPFLNRLLWFFAAIGGMGCLWGMYRFRGKALYYYSIVCHGFGLIIMELTCVNMLHRMDEPGAVIIQLIRGGSLYLEGLAIAAAWLVWLGAGKKEVS